MAPARRTQEYHAVDMYLEWPIDSAGADVNCIGLNWPMPRPVRQIGIAFKDKAPWPDGAVAQIWVGPTAFQGEWKPLPGKVEVRDNTWRLDIKAGTSFQKSPCWILPKTAAAMGVSIELGASTLAPGLGNSIC